ncbi:MAG: hypothetical protein ACTSYW_00415 [Candidatus Heimdallarchaeota archaeon]
MPKKTKLLTGKAKEKALEKFKNDVLKLPPRKMFKVFDNLVKKAKIEEKRELKKKD